MSKPLRSALGSFGIAALVALSVQACGDAGAEPNDASGFGSNGSSSGGASSSGGFGNTGGDGGGAANGDGACAVDGDCNDGDACTKDVCDVSASGEFTNGVCGHTPVAGKECTNSTGTGMPPAVDTTCAPGCNKTSKTYPPPVTLVPQVTSCTKGFELNNLRGSVYTIDATAAGGAPASDIEVEFATYLAPDHIKIDGVTATGTYPLVDTCTVQTWDKADPTDGCTRPPDETIRQYKVSMKAGTKQIKVDLTGVCSPIYLRVRGLCAFNVQPFVQTCGFRSLP